MTTINDLDDFQALEPFFRIIEQGLDGLADGGHFFDLLAEDVVFDYIITTPGYPRHVEGRQAVAELYRRYGDMIVLDRCHDLAVHHDPNTGVVVLEYASQGRVVRIGGSYANRYISVLTIADRKVTRSRDYLDPVAVFDALVAFALGRAPAPDEQRASRRVVGPRLLRWQSDSAARLFIRACPREVGAVTGSRRRTSAFARERWRARRVPRRSRLGFQAAGCDGRSSCRLPSAEHRTTGRPSEAARAIARPAYGCSASTKLARSG